MSRDQVALRLPDLVVGQSGGSAALDEAAIVATTDVTGRIVYVNDKFCQISGYSREELINENHRLLRSNLHSKDFFRAMYKVIARGNTWHGELCNKAKDGSYYWVDTTIVPRRDANGKIAFYDAIRFDITPLKHAEERLRVEARTDPLTGLPNRKHFAELLAEKIEICRENSGSFALVLLDLDGFKDINDSFGHDTGDRFLQVVGRRLVKLLGSDITVARLGGDEFTLIIPTDSTGFSLHSQLDELTQALREPISIDGYDQRSTASMGVTFFPSHAVKPNELIKNADIALYRAKARGRDRVEFFDSAMAVVAAQRTALHQQVDKAIRNAEFRLFFQPIINIRHAERTLAGLEALLRWQHPQQGLIGPARFMEVFDDPGLSAEIGHFVATTAVAQAVEWSNRDLEFGKITINVTSADLRSGGLDPSFAQMIHDAGLRTNRFSIEVTEGMFLGRGSERVLASLERMHRAGLKIALDDFGTGFASLKHLKTLPIDRIKIDRSFVDQIERDRSNRAIVQGLIGIAHSLDLWVTAEGVETEIQLHELQRFNCDQAQGYLIAKPMHPDRIPHFITQLDASAIAQAV